MENARAGDGPDRRAARGPDALAAAGPAARPVHLASVLLAALLAGGAGGCALAGPGSGLTRSAETLGWGPFAIAMSRKEVEARTGRRLELREIESPCAGAGARVTAGDEELFLAFERDAPEAALRTIVRRLPEDAARERATRELRRELPGLRYRPDPRWPEMPEEEDPTPLYTHPEAPGQAVELRFDDGWLWIGEVRCLEDAGSRSARGPNPRRQRESER